MNNRELNVVYKPLDIKARDISDYLNNKNLDCSYGFYNGHFYKNETGIYEISYYPIPVITVKNLCDIEINTDGIISISSKLERNRALIYDYQKLNEIEFEAYGTESYLNDFFIPGQDLKTLKFNIKNSLEKEIGFSFKFYENISCQFLCDFILFLKEEGFYY